MNFELVRRHVVEYFLDPSVIDSVDVGERHPFSAQRFGTAEAADGRPETKQQNNQFAGSATTKIRDSRIPYFIPYTSAIEKNHTDKLQLDS